MLVCNKKGCTENNFPLKIVAKQIDKREFEFQPDFIKRMINALSWPAIVSAAKDVCIFINLQFLANSSKLNFNVPTELPANATEDEALLKNLHEVLNEVLIYLVGYWRMEYSLSPQVQVTTGDLVCPNCGRAYQIENGIPNMLLNEDEV